MTDKVARKVVMQAFRPRGGNFMTIATVLIVVGTVFLLAHGAGGGIIIAAIAVFALCAMLSTVVKMATHQSKEKRLMKTITADARRVMIDRIGKEPKYIDTQGCASKSHAGSIVGTGIAFDGQKVFILDDGELGEIPWEMVRSWHWSIEGYETVKIYSNGPATGKLTAQLEANADNARASVNAKMKSGFFVSVADVEKPEWQFTCWDQATLKKWGEIFAQINEGRLRAA